MKKKILKITALFVLVLLTFFYFAFKPGGILSATELGHLVSLIFRMNVIEIKVDNDLSREKINIFWRCFSKASKPLIKKGKKVGNLEPCYGGNVFSVYYDNKHIAEISHGKFNNWHYHKYRFRFFKSNDGVKVDLNVIGPDAKVDVFNLDKKTGQSRKHNRREHLHLTNSNACPG